MDRNTILLIMSMTPSRSLSARRAWIEILVLPGFKSFRNSSLSARRAWIEIHIILGGYYNVAVALRKESVDRNMWWGVRKAVGSLSLSARRAWIEIYSARHKKIDRLVALRKESVDRNALGGLGGAAPQGRSPQGERG